MTIRETSLNLTSNGSLFFHTLTLISSVSKGRVRGRTEMLELSRRRLCFLVMILDFQLCLRSLVLVEMFIV